MKREENQGIGPFFFPTYFVAVARDEHFTIGSQHSSSRPDPVGGRRRCRQQDVDVDVRTDVSSTSHESAGTGQDRTCGSRAARSVASGSRNGCLRHRRVSAVRNCVSCTEMMAAIIPVPRGASTSELVALSIETFSIISAIWLYKTLLYIVYY